MFKSSEKVLPVEWVEDLQLLYRSQHSMNYDKQSLNQIAFSSDSSAVCDAESRTLLYRDEDIDPAREAVRYLELTLIQGFSDVLYPRWGDSVIDTWEIAQAISASRQKVLDDSRWPLRGAYTVPIKHKCLTVAHLPCNILLISESGTGKEAVARYIHAASVLQGKFVAGAMPAIPESLFESEFFGIVEGAATGVLKKEGLLSQAAGGTLFLDEVADLASTAQVKLLRTLSDRHYRPVGATEDRELSCRIISATNQREKFYDVRAFREDLRARLDQVKFSDQEEFKPLRMIRQEIPLLFAMEFAKTLRKAVGFEVRCSSVAFGKEIIHNLCDPTLQWELNFRQLQLVAHTAVTIILHDYATKRVRPKEDALIEMRDKLKSGVTIPPLKLRSRRDLINPPLLNSLSIEFLLNNMGSDTNVWDTILARTRQEALDLIICKCGGNRKKAASILGVSERTLQRRAKPSS